MTKLLQYLQYFWVLIIFMALGMAWYTDEAFFFELTVWFMIGLPFVMVSYWFMQLIDVAILKVLEWRTKPRN